MATKKVTTKAVKATKTQSTKAEADPRPRHEQVVFGPGMFPPEYLEHLADMARHALFDWLLANAPYETVALLNATHGLYKQAGITRETGKSDPRVSDIDEYVVETIKAMCAVGATFSDDMESLDIGPYVTAQEAIEEA